MKKKKRFYFVLATVLSLSLSLSLSLFYPHLVSQRFRAANAIASSCKVFFRTEGCINKARYKSVYFIGTFALEFLLYHEGQRVSAILCDCRVYRLRL